VELDSNALFQAVMTIISGMGLVIFKGLSKKVDSMADSVTDLNKNIATLIANDQNKQREIELNREEINKLRIVNHDINNVLTRVMAKQDLAEIKHK